jgi:hypothetical protein
LPSSTTASTPPSSDSSKRSSVAPPFARTPTLHSLSTRTLCRRAGTAH